MRNKKLVSLILTVVFFVTSVFFPIPIGAFGAIPEEVSQPVYDRSVFMLQQESLGKNGLQRGLKKFQDTVIAPAKEPDFKFESKKKILKTKFAGINGELAKLSWYDKSVAYSVYEALPVAGKVKDNAIQYKNILPGIDIVYYSATDGIKGDIILNKKLDFSSITFILDVQGLSPKIEDGQIIFYDTKNYPVFYIPKPFMTDKKGNVSSKVDMQLEQKDEKYFLGLVPDPAWLETAEYPVIIDPSTSLWPGFLGHERFWEYWEYDIDQAGKLRVNLFNGNLALMYLDQYFVGQGSPTFLVRTYNSQASSNGIMGYNWTHNYYGFVLENADGSVTYTDEDGTQSVFTLNADGTYKVPTGIRMKLIKNIDASGIVTFTMEQLKTHTVDTYDASGNLIKRADNNGNTTTFNYSDGALTSITDPSGQVTTFHSPYSGVLYVRDPADKIFSYEYDSYGNLISVTNPNGDVVTMNYIGPEHLLTSITDGRGQTISIGYDLEGRVTSITLPGQPSISFYYYHDYVFDEHRTTVNNIGGSSYMYYFNSNGNKLGFTEGFDITSYTWDSDMNLTSIIDPKGNKTTFTYDTFGNLLSEIGPNQNVIMNYQYDTNNNLIKITDAENSYVSLNYDMKNNVTSGNDPLGSSTQLGYDLKGNTTTMTDGNLKTTSYEYDSKGNIIKATDPLNSIATYEYDTSNNLTSARIEYNGNTLFSTNYSYDNLNRLSTLSAFQGGTVRREYDPNGNLHEINQANGNYVSYTYNGNNQLTDVNFNGALNYLMRYDNNGNLSRQELYGQPFSYDYSYNDKEQLVTVTEIDGKRMDYTYDANGNVTQSQVTVGSTIYNTDYTYDENNQITTVTEQGGTRISFDYGANNRIERIYYPNGILKEIFYDTSNKITEIKETNTLGQVLFSQRYEYDGEGNKTRVWKWYGDQGYTEEYRYDALNRLVYERQSDTGLEIAYEYDPAGNRTKKDITGPVSEYNRYYYSYPDGTLIGVNNTQYMSDSSGNLLEDGQKTYAWDASNRLTEVRDSATNTLIASFNYDSQGRRLTQTTPQGTIYYHYDGNRVSYETDENGSILRMYTYDRAGVPLTLRYQGQTYYYRTDDRGDVLGLVDSTGTLVATYRYDAWGNILEANGTLAEINPYRYAGYRYDQATGLYFLHARYYNPDLGRFLSADEMLGNPKSPQSFNPFTYVENNPVNRIDESGRDWISTGLGAAGAALTVAGVISTAPVIGTASLIVAALTVGYTTANVIKNKRFTADDAIGIAGALPMGSVIRTVASAKVGASTAKLAGDVYGLTVGKAATAYDFGKTVQQSMSKKSSSYSSAKSYRSRSRKRR